MKIEDTVDGGIGILSFSGSLVFEESTDLKTLINPYLDDQQYIGIICNLEKVDYIDSSGLGVIVSIFKSLKGANRKFAISGLNERNRELFNISKLDKLLIIASNTESALEILNE